MANTILTQTGAQVQAILNRADQVIPASLGSTGQVLAVSGTNTTSWQTIMSNPLTSRGDLMVGGTSGKPTRMTVGTNGQVLTSNGSIPVWATPSYPVGGVSSIGGMTGTISVDASFITNSPTLSLSGQLPYATITPTTTNTAGFMKIVVLTAGPATRYQGYLYIITKAPTSTLITFTVTGGGNGDTYQAESGMTWEQWVASSYNTDQFTIENGYVRVPNTTSYVYASSPTNNVASTDEIIANYAYSFLYSGGSND